MKTCYTSLRGGDNLGLLLIIAVLFIALALCNKYSPEDAKTLRWIIKIIVIIVCAILVFLLVILIIAIITPFILRSML